MLAMSMLTWWYGQGWAEVLASLSRRARKVAGMFSVATLLRTLFAPWRRIISVPGKNLAGHFYAALDNLLSRCIGFVVRLFVLLAAVVALVFVLTASILELIVWPVLPIACVICLVEGLMRL